MTRQTMRTMRRWLPAVLLIGMPIPSWAAEIPSEVRTMVNTWEFVASFAIRCDIDLSFRGLQGIHTHDCQVFMREFQRANDALQASRGTLSAAAAAVDQSRDRALQQKWGHLIDRFNRSLDHVTRTNERLESLLKAEADTPKKPGRRPKK